MQIDSTFYDLIIVGGGHAGGTCAEKTRRGGFAGSIGLVTAEPVGPYQRPPLSKDYLLGYQAFNDLAFQSLETWADLGVDLITQTTISEVDPIAKRVIAADGHTFTYGDLVWAAGSEPRSLKHLPGGDCEGIFTIRTLADVDQILGHLPTAETCVIVGGGFIGLEAAAILRTLGKKVTLVERGEQLLGRTCAAPVSQFLRRAHEARGVRFLFGQQVAGFEAYSGQVAAVSLGGGESLEADMVIVGIGIVPNIEPLKVAGLADQSGVPIDGQCRTRDAHIFAVGDCASFESAYAPGAPIRLESVQNAQDQGAHVSRVLAGKAGDYAALPTFWSDQYDFKIQTVGLSRGYNEIVLRVFENGLSVLYFKAGLFIAIDTINAMRDAVHARKLVGVYKTDWPHQFSDTSRSLKQCAT